MSTDRFHWLIWDVKHLESEGKNILTIEMGALYIGLIKNWG